MASQDARSAPEINTVFKSEVVPNSKLSVRIVRTLSDSVPIRKHDPEVSVLHSLGTG